MWFLGSLDTAKGWWSSSLLRSELRRAFWRALCQQAYHNHLRKDKRTEEPKKDCEVCSHVFTAIRRDAKASSDSCNQKPYRWRKKEVDLSR